MLQLHCYEAKDDMLLMCLFVQAAKSLNQQTSPSPGVMQALVEQVTLTYAVLTRGSRLHAAQRFMTLKIMVATNAALQGGFLHKVGGGRHGLRPAIFTSANKGRRV